jgi:hypothetical protein
VLVAITQSIRVGGLFGRSTVVMTIWVSSLARASPADLHPLILAKMASDFGHQKLVKQWQILLLLIRCRNPPETAETEPRDVIDIHGRTTTARPIGGSWRRLWSTSARTRETRCPKGAP